MRVLARILVAFLLPLLLVTPAAAETPVDIALVLAVDASGSIDADEFKENTQNADQGKAVLRRQATLLRHSHGVGARIRERSGAHA